MLSLRCRNPEKNVLVISRPSDDRLTGRASKTRQGCSLGSLHPPGTAQAPPGPFLPPGGGKQHPQNTLQAYSLSLLPLNALFRDEMHPRLTGSTTCWWGRSPDGQSLGPLRGTFTGASGPQSLQDTGLQPGKGKQSLPLLGGLVLGISYRKQAGHHAFLSHLSPFQKLLCLAPSTPGEAQLSRIKLVLYSPTACPTHPHSP